MNGTQHDLVDANLCVAPWPTPTRLSASTIPTPCWLIATPTVDHTATNLVIVILILADPNQTRADLNPNLVDPMLVGPDQALVEHNAEI